MTSFHRAAVAAAAAVLMSSAGAFAADLYGGSMKDGGGYVPANNTSPARIYLRGDFSEIWNDFGTMTEAPTYTDNNAHIGNSHAWGGGVGVYFTPAIRGDLTLDWSSKAAVDGTNATPGATVPGERQFGVKHLVGLANLYYDFDTRTRFTPYLGVGLGFARNTTTAGQVAISGCASTTCSAAMDGTGKTNAAGALMAGFSAKLADRWSLDAGYRFLYTGDANTSDIQITRNPLAVGAPTSTPGVQVHDMYEHELRVGLRMDLR